MFPQSKPGYRSVQVWTSRVSRSAPAQVATLSRWIGGLAVNGGELAGLSPDELVAFQLESKDYAILDLLQAWILNLGGRAGSKERCNNTIRSIFMHNRAELPRDRGFCVSSEEAPVRGSLSLEEVRHILDASNPLNRAVILSMVSGGMGFGEVEYWNRTGLARLSQQLRDDVRPIRVDLWGVRGIEISDLSILGSARMRGRLS